MPVLCFVIDTSASMNQRTNGGQRIVDQAKTAVENFISKVKNKIAQKKS
jgi:Mg-chelatase subunit ChlD